MPRTKKAVARQEAVSEANGEVKILAFKGFDEKLQCRGFQFEALLLGHG